jgi:curved DNA-binding protein CbpA
VRAFAGSTSEKTDEKKRRFNFFKKKGKVTQKTFYDVLGVDSNATQETIRSRYLELAKLHHPDSGGSTQEFAEISAAWKVLGNKNDRAVYDARLEFNPEHASDAAGYDAEEIDWSLRVIMSSGYLKIGPHPQPLPRTVLIPLVWMGVEQVEGDTPVYRRFYRLGLMWTLFLLIAFRQLYITLRDWRPYQEDQRPWMQQNREARSKFAWRVLGLSIALSTLPLWYRRWDFLSKGVKEVEGGERMADIVARIFPSMMFWTLGLSFACGPVIGSGTEFMYSHLNRKDLQWNQPVFDVLEFNGSRILQGLGAASMATLCVQRAQAKGLPMKFCGKAAIIGLITGRMVGWLLSFAFVSNSRRISLKQPNEIVKEPPTLVTPPVEPHADQLAQLQREVEQLRQALQKQALKVDSS